MAKKRKSTLGTFLALLAGAAFMLLAVTIAYLNHQQLNDLADIQLPLGFVLILALGGGGLVTAFLLLGFFSRRHYHSQTDDDG